MTGDGFVQVLVYLASSLQLHVETRRKDLREEATVSSLVVPVPLTTSHQLSDGS